jgi:lipopolysaccharide biosynthesis glycosyltransferase
MYKILIHYITGDSFYTEEAETYVEHCWPHEGEIEWSNIDAAKESLRRIKEHYEWYMSTEQYGHLRTTYKKNHGRDMRGFREFCVANKPDWHTDEDMPLYRVTLVNDKMQPVSCNTSWIGYFEILNGASIVGEQEDGWSFTI